MGLCKIPLHHSGSESSSAPQSHTVADVMGSRGKPGIMGEGFSAAPILYHGPLFYKVPYFSISKPTCAFISASVLSISALMRALIAWR